MSDSHELDFTDPAIRGMVSLHWPTDRYHRDGELASVTCDIDGQWWPCEPVQALRKWQEKQ